MNNKVNNGMLICSFYIQKRYQHGNNNKFSLNSEFNLTTENGNNCSFFDAFDLFESFCDFYNDLYDDEKNKKVFSINKDSIKKYDEDKYRALSFVIKSGNYGVEADMTDRKTKKIKHHRNVNEADIKEFHCVVYIPKDADNHKISKGIIIFQSIATYGVKMITYKLMREYLVKYGLMLKLSSVSVKAFIEKLVEQGKLNKITLIRNNISYSSGDNMFIQTGKEEKAYINPILKKKGLDKFLKIFDKADSKRIYEIPEELNCDDISITFDLNGKYRTVRLRNLENFSIVEDIPDCIFNETNHEEKLINYMIETADNYRKKIVMCTQNEV